MSEFARLLAAALAGDPVARGDLLERLRPRIVLWATVRLSRELRAKVDPEDVAQLVLLAVHDGLDRFAGTGEKPFLAWVFSIAEHRVIDLARHFGASKRTPEGDGSIADELARARSGRRSFSRTSPSEAAARSDEIARMHAAMDALPETHRDILRLRDLEEREYPEIVQRLQLKSVGAARTMHCRALVALRDAMDDTGKQSS
jgi:RNA polymerase sigma-70 factor (subfamily 1)